MTSPLLKIVSVVGARPQFIKLAPVSRAFEALREHVSHTIVHTGQHYDEKMSDIFFGDLQIPKPHVDLNVGSGPHGRQTASMLTAIESAFLENIPNAVIVYGDTNSTLAATLAASKLHIPLAHIEAGLRSFNRKMPEEINRVVADHCSDRLYAPTPLAIKNLKREGLEKFSCLSGDVMLDTVLNNAKIARERSEVLERFNVAPHEFGVVTIHRPVNTNEKTISRLLEIFIEVANSTLPLIFPMHPRTRAIVGDSINIVSDRLKIVDPLGYLDMLRLLESAKLAITDSGGLQKEAMFLGTPCITVRDETEWAETIKIGANRLVGIQSDQILKAVTSASESDPSAWKSAVAEHYGTGEAAVKICADMVSWLENSN